VNSSLSRLGSYPFDVVKIDRSFVIRMTDGHRDQAVVQAVLHLADAFAMDVIAEGVVAATRGLGLKVPLVVRLEGTNVELGKKILNDSGLKIQSADSMADGAKKIVASVRG
jgi:succinyl-CoA synthetase beta subunit